MSIQITTLPNGLRVVTDRMDDAESVTLGAWVGTGARHEPWEANGLAHMAEHMMFKGTKRRSAYALSAAIENKGGAMNAHTTREETAYYARVLPEDAALAADIIADMMQRSTFPPKELDREKQVVIQEIGRDRDTPEDHVYDLMHKAAFPRQKIGRSILGSEDVVARMPRDELAAYVKRHYQAGNMVVVATGKLVHEEIVALAKRHFGRMPGGETPKLRKAAIKPGDLRVDKDSEQLHLMLAFPGPGVWARNLTAANVLGVILGGSSSSRLFQKVREKRGLVYNISAYHMPFQDVGLFNIYAGTDPARAAELMPVIGRELKDVCRHITPIELRRAKAQIKAELLMGQESVMRRAEVLGSQMLSFGEPVSMAYTLRRIEAVSVESVQRIAGKIFSAKPVLAALGPSHGLESYDSFADRLKG